MKRETLKTALNNVPLLQSTQNTQTLLQESKRRGISNAAMDRSATILSGLQTTSNELIGRNTGMTHTEIDYDLFDKVRISLQDITNIQQKLHGEKIKSINNALRAMTRLAQASQQDPNLKNLIMQLCDNDQQTFNSVMNGAFDSAMPLQFALYEMVFSNELLVSLVKILTERLTSNVDTQAMINVYQKLCSDLEVHQNDANLRKIIEDNMQQEIVKVFDDDPEMFDKLERIKRNQFTGFVPSGIAPGIISHAANVQRFGGVGVAPVQQVQQTPVMQNQANVTGVAYTGRLNATNSGINYNATIGNPVVNTQTVNAVPAQGQINSGFVSTNRASYGTNYTGRLNPQGVQNNTGVIQNTAAPVVNMGGYNQTPVTSFELAHSNPPAQVTNNRLVMGSDGQQYLVDANNNVVSIVTTNQGYGTGMVNYGYNAANEAKVDQVLRSRPAGLDNTL